MKAASAGSAGALARNAGGIVDAGVPSSMFLTKGADEGVRVPTPDFPAAFTFHDILLTFCP